MKHDDLEKCETVMKCPVCGHYHNHMGCKECDCKICPHCMHVHDEHHKSH
jgi:hypothetical protein